MISNITKREKGIGMIAASVALAAFVYNFAVEPLAKRWNGLTNEIRAKEAVLRNHTRIWRDREKIEKSRSDYAAYFHAGQITPEEESAIALSQIEKLARSANVHITNIKPLAAKTFENHTKSTFRISLEAPIEGLSKFIYDLQASDQLLKIERMVLRAKEKEQGTIKAMLNVTKLSVF